MKRYILIAYILLLTLTLGAANPASVSITLTTKVPGYLYHGFLDSLGATAFFEAPPTVNDAFNPDGAVLNYGIKTNVGLPLTVKATIAPFEEQDVANPEYIAIEQVIVDNTTIDPVGGKYQILSFTPSSGTIYYRHKLTVLVEQSQLTSKPIGNYKSTVSIEIQQ